MELSGLDITVFILFIISVVSVGFIVGRRKQDTVAEYFLAGNRIPWYAIGVSIIAASISTEQFLGEVGFAYKNGLVVANWEWANFIAQSMLAFIFIPVFLRQRIVTIPEYLARRFDDRCRTLFAVLLVISYAFINLAGVLYLGGFAIEVLFGVNRWAALWILAALAGAYTIYGGLTSVVWTDLLQGSILLGGGVLVFVLGLLAVPDGFSGILSSGDRAHLMLPSSHPVLPWTAILAITFVTNIFYYCSNQYINQRCLAARTEWDARMGVIFSAFLGIPLALAVTFPGMIAYALEPSLEVADRAYPYIVAKLVPIGLRGIIFAALTGAVMSTIASLVSSSSAIVTVNLYQRFLNPRATDRQMIRVGRLVGLSVLLIGALWTPVVKSFELIFSYFQECWVFFSAPIVVVFAGGILWRRATSTAAFYTLLMGFPMLILVFLRRGFFPFINPFNMAGLASILMLGFFIAVSLATARPTALRTAENVWQRKLFSLAERGVIRRWWTSEKFWWG
ncbi:MAG TPA: sodium/solute symporter, partial [archaeon]|nr:sodium/solute symporter [archaeon]